MTLPVPRSSVGFLGLLAAGAAFAFLGMLPVLAAVGVVRSSGGIEPIGRIVAFLFGMALVAVGTGIAAVPLLALARSHGAPTWRDALRLGRRRLWARADRRSAAAAASVGLLAAVYLLAIVGIRVPVLGAPDTLIAIVAVEFIVIHGFLFFAVAAWFARAAQGWLRVAAAVVLVMLFAMYGVLAWGYGGGIAGIGALAYLLVPNLLALTNPASDASQQLQVAARWCIKFAVFMLVSATVGDSDMAGPGNIAQGAAYFSLFTVLELFRVVEIPGDLAAAWSAPPLGPPQRPGVADAGPRRDV